MILYQPSNGDATSAPVDMRPRTCFLMTRLRPQVPEEVLEARTELRDVLLEHDLDLVDAESRTTGKDFMLKIWQLFISVPVGIAIVYQNMPSKTMANIFYELGWMEALGKEVVVIRIGSAPIPSDWVRTEFIVYDDRFRERIRAFVRSLRERAAHFEHMAELLEKDPLLALDYYRRAYLLTGEERPREMARRVLAATELGERAKNSVEQCLARFCTRGPVDNKAAALEAAAAKSH